MKFPVRKPSVAAALVLAAFLCPVGSAQTFHGQHPATSLPGIPFVPDDHVPLSSFEEFNSGASPVTIAVSVDVLDYIDGESGSFEVMYKRILYPFSEGTIVLDPQTDVDFVQGEVSFAPPQFADYVFVSDVLVNDYLGAQDDRLVTHYDATYNCGKGGFALGAHDPLGDTDAAVCPVGNPTCGDENPYDEHSLKHDTDYCLFVDPSGNDCQVSCTECTGECQETPFYERYKGEDHATTTHATAENAVALSDQILDGSGFPVLFHNYTGSMPTLLEGAPVFQVVNCYIVGDINTGSSVSIDRDDRSLAAFLLPPYWSSQATPYPVIANGFYDIYVTLFGPGSHILLTLGDLINNSSESLVGVLWNGGGSGAATMQRSAYDNAARLMDDAAYLVNADTSQVLWFGGSRGGTTALAMAANPYHDNYETPVVDARLPQLKPGQQLTEFNDPTYGLVMSAASGYTGYRLAWQQAWEDPSDTYSGAEVFMYNVLGSTSASTIDADRANSSPDFIDELVEQDTKVVLRVGTHDFSRAFYHSVLYVALLREAGVDVRFEISYRFGHGAEVDLYPSLEDLVYVMLGTETFVDGTFHYRRLSEDEEDASEGVAFDPHQPDQNLDVTDCSSNVDPPVAHLPITLECPPAAVALGQTPSFILVGEPDVDYELRIYEASIDAGNCTATPGTLVWSQSGTLDHVLDTGTFTSEFGYENIQIDIETPTFTATYAYYYELEYEVNGTCYVVPENAIAQPFDGCRLPYFIVGPAESFANYPYDGELWSGLSHESRTGGLSSDVLFWWD